MLHTHEYQQPRNSMFDLDRYSNNIHGCLEVAIASPLWRLDIRAYTESIGEVVLRKEVPRYFTSVFFSIGWMGIQYLDRQCDRGPYWCLFICWFWEEVGTSVTTSQYTHGVVQISVISVRSSIKRYLSPTPDPLRPTRWQTTSPIT